MFITTAHVTANLKFPFTIFYPENGLIFGTVAVKGKGKVVPVLN
jgi:hypothetical protein